jgi:hypothetical protein
LERNIRGPESIGEDDSVTKFPTGRRWMDILGHGLKESLILHSGLRTVSSPQNITPCPWQGSAIDEVWFNRDANKCDYRV